MRAIVAKKLQGELRTLRLVVDPEQQRSKNS